MDSGPMSRSLSILVLAVTLLVGVSAASAADQELVELGQAMIEPLRQGLKRIFVFPNFEMSVEECGEANAFSDYATGNITLCTEFIGAVVNAPEFDVDAKAAALTFVLLHETGHSLLNLWGEPLYDNEDAVDEFAAVFLLIGGQDAAVRQAATYWASKGSIFQALSKVWADDRHSLSEQRARNLQSWIGRRDELLRRWQRVIIPHLQTNLLRGLARDGDDWVDKTLVKKELSQR